MNEFAHDVIFLENRRTPKIVPKGEKYEPSEAEGKIKKRRAATEEEEKTISRGDWVRVNEQGDKPSDPGYKRKKSKVRPQKQTNAGHALTFGTFLNTVMSEFIAMQGSIEGYAGVTHAGIAMVAADTGRVLLAQRAYDATDDEDVAETWEFPGGGLGEGEHPWAGALREFGEEVGPPPEGEVIDGWRSDDEVYQCFVYRVPTEVDFGTGADSTEVQAVAWASRDELPQYTLRPEVEMQTDWSLVFPETTTEDEMTDENPEPDDAEYADLDLDGPIPVHGVIAPEEMPSGDKRAFSKGAMTRRPLSIPLRDTNTDIGGHDGAYLAGRVDRMMRKDGLIHYDGALMPGTGDSLAAKMEFMGGRFGVSVDGDQGSMDEARTEATNTLWFDSIRAAGLTAVDIPAFHEAYVAFGPHPDMPTDSPEDAALTASAYDAGDYIGASAFGRGPGTYTNPIATKRIRDYWCKPGEKGYALIAWGTPGDFTRCVRLVGEKIAKNSPAKLKYMNQIAAQWHHDVLGYWPGEKGKPGNAPKTALSHTALSIALAEDDSLKVDVSEDDTDNSVWEAVLVSSAVSGNRKRPPLSYFHQHPSMAADPWAAESGALVIEEPDEHGFQRAWGYAAQWGVCHTGMDGKCVEPPQSYSDDYPDFHLGRTKTEDGYVYTGVLTYGVGHRDAKTILAESPEQAMFDNIKNAWASVRVGENERGIWFSGVVLPKVDDGDLTLIEASGQVSGEWLAGEMRACLTVGVPGFPNQRASAAYDNNGNVLALAASAFGIPAGEQGPCADNGEGEAGDDPIGDVAMAVWSRIKAHERLTVLQQADANRRFAVLRSNWEA